MNEARVAQYLELIEKLLGRLRGDEGFVLTLRAGTIDRRGIKLGKLTKVGRGYAG